MNLAIKCSFVFLSFWMFLISCSNPESFAEISVQETKGLSRELEYITAKIKLPVELQPSEILMVKDHETDEAIPVQVLDTVQNEGSPFMEIMFPVKMKANSTKTFELVAIKKMNNTLPLDIEFSQEGASVENQIYKANFSTKTDPRGGQLSQIVLKNFDDRLLNRGHIAMHWAPNFSRSDKNGYFNMENLPTTSENLASTGFYQITKLRSGRTDQIPEIKVKGNYTFFANLPYFFFESTMTMEKDVALKLLRNDEMTMDSLFTHVAYQKRDGTVARLKLYDAELESLENNHIPDDSGFVAFYNTNYNYGLASIRLEYNNTNSEGNPSPLFNPHTKISKSRNNGRYWNRVLIDSATSATSGSQYHEKNAYLIFEVKKSLAEEEILYYAERLMNPLKVTIKQF